jgi:hypothetical protein
VTARDKYQWDKHSAKWLYTYAPKLKLKITPDDILDMITLVMQHCWMYSRYYPGKIFRQCRGLAMGTNSAPMLANLSLAVVEIFNGLGYSQVTHNWMDWRYPPAWNQRDELDKDIPDYIVARYIDDILAANTTPQTLQPQLDQWYCQTGLRLNPGTTTDTGVAFLDMHIALVTQDELLLSLFSKPGTAHSYHHADSYIHKSVLKGLIIGGLKRINNLNPSDLRRRMYHTLYFIKNLIRRGYSPSFITNTVRKFESTQDDRLPTDYRIVISYHECIDLSWLRNYMKSIQPDKTKELVFRTQPNLASKVARHYKEYIPMFAPRSRSRSSTGGNPLHGSHE